MNSSYLSKENLITKQPALTSSELNKKVYLREQKGKFQHIRRSLSIVLVIIFALLPFIKHQGTQAIYFDLQQQEFHIFSLTLFPQDLLIVCLLFIFAALLLFYVTKFYGRVWCGFSCPQTIWMLLFNWIERRVEGTHNHSKSLDEQPWHLKKLAKKSIKHSLWGAVSLLTALAFVSYFVKVDELYSDFFSLQSSSIVTAWVLFFALCTYINAGWIREKMCQHMCPYSRFQSAMFDKYTSLVTYDHSRGENRGKRKRSQVKPQTMGDCVDCNLCVQVCPVGIDIRAGLQYECINCGLCVDACDMTMDKFKYKQGLISFTGEKAPQQSWKRHLSYGSLTCITLVMIWGWASTWQSYEVNIIRDRQALYRVNQDGNIENTYRFKIRNKSNQIKHYRIETHGLDSAQILNTNTVKVMPTELSTHSVTVSVNNPLTSDRNDISFNIVNIEDNETLIKTSSFFSSKAAW